MLLFRSIKKTNQEETSRVKWLAGKSNRQLLSLVWVNDCLIAQLLENVVWVAVQVVCSKALGDAGFPLIVGSLASTDEWWASRDVCGNASCMAKGGRWCGPRGYWLLPGNEKVRQHSWQKFRLIVEAQAAASPSKQNLAASNEISLVDWMK